MGTAKDFMNDFATQDFLDKNIRVRPVSGVTRGDNEGKTNDPFNKSMGGDDVEDYEKFEQMRVLEMQDQRIQAKALRDEFLKKKALEEKAQQEEEMSSRGSIWDLKENIIEVSKYFIINISAYISKYYSLFLLLKS